MTAWVLLSLLSAEPPASGPLPSALAHGLLEAAAVVEVEVPLEPTGTLEQRWAKGVAKASHAVVVASRAPLEPEAWPLKPWPVLRSCLGRLAGRSSVRALVVIHLDGRPGVFPLASLGLSLETTAGYDKLKDALREFYTWTDERKRGAKWEAQRLALTSTNAYLRHLAAEYLTLHDAAAVVDEVWGLPGSSERKENEGASRVAPRCQ